jgi:hypothetical protein
MDELKRRAAQLDSDLKAVDVSTQANTAALQDIREELARNNRSRRWIVASLAALLLLLAGVGFVAFQSAQTARAQAELRSDVLCPLYGIFLGSYDPGSRPEGDARRKYDDAYQQIRQGWQIMRCAGTAPIVPPRTDQ